MQGEKNRAYINASFDFSSGTLSATMLGSHVAVCLILGQLARNVALSKAKGKGIPEKQALEEVLRIAAEEAHYSRGSGIRLDLSVHTRRTDHD